MERWFKTGSIRPENRQPTTVDRSKENNNSCSKNNSVELHSEQDVYSSALESTIPDVEIMKGNKKRKYDDSYLDMGFTKFSDGRPHLDDILKLIPTPQIKPSYFKRKSDELHSTQKTFVSHVKTHSEKALKASYLVSYELALAGKPQTLAETLIKPLLVKDLSYDVKDTIISRISQTTFSLQLDESTDVVGLAVIITFVRYEFSGIFHEDILFCKPLPSSTSGNGAKAMVGNVAGVVARIKKVSANCTSSHCILHQHSLATKKMPVLLK
ncbi:zinc finger BED domain-containing protein 5-like [Sipha flava]|uniref:Zinc finger BED domain-containing protein 5-like n=1 Tax=Sipha flava TaxID=143950 RepID=A0A8B8GPT8_9HEMI|nr:zinc finger BED domain-containing protein 5-like [Sipha flava]